MIHQFRYSFTPNAIPSLCEGNCKLSLCQEEEAAKKKTAEEAYRQIWIDEAVKLSDDVEKCWEGSLSCKHSVLVLPTIY